MYSGLIISLFNSKCDIYDEINAAQTQDIMYKIGIPFNRSSMIRLHSARILGSDIKVAESRKQKRVTTTLLGLVKIIVFYLAGGPFPGYRRINKLIELLDVTDLMQSEYEEPNSYVEDLVKDYDKLIFKHNVESDDYNPKNNKNGHFDLKQKARLVLRFLYHWFLGRCDYTDADFYYSWELIRDRVLSDDGELVLHNQYQQDHTWKPNGLIGIEEGNGSLVTSILTLEHFIKTAPAEDVRKVQCWFEIILTFENGSGFITGEAKAALKSVPTLNQQALISDWYLLAYIYYYSMNPIKFKYGVSSDN